MQAGRQGSGKNVSLNFTCQSSDIDQWAQRWPYLRTLAPEAAISGRDK